MNKLINAIVGENAKPSKRYAVIAALATAAALIIAVVVLAVSSIIFAVTDSDDTVPPSGVDAEGDGVGATSIEYKTVTKQELDGMVAENSLFYEEQRTIQEGHRYYAKKDSSVVLSESVMRAAHEMLVGFYNNNKSSLKTETGSSGNYSEECNIPMVENVSSDKKSFDLVVFNKDDQPMENAGIYKWIFENAYSYGFIYSGNTFTYVGIPAATYMKGGITLDSFINEAKDKTVPISAKALGTAKTTSYQLYYIAGDCAEIKLPSNYNYTVIANGSGYIVAVDMSSKIIAAAQ